MSIYVLFIYELGKERELLSQNVCGWHETLPNNSEWIFLQYFIHPSSPAPPCQVLTSHCRQELLAKIEALTSGHAFIFTNHQQQACMQLLEQMPASVFAQSESSIFILKTHT
jgi:hypothetical protein